MLGPSLFLSLFHGRLLLTWRQDLHKGLLPVSLHFQVLTADISMLGVSSDSAPARYEHHNMLWTNVQFGVIILAKTASDCQYLFASLRKVFALFIV